MTYEIEDTDTIVCPHCGASSDDDDIKTSQIIDCGQCGRAFHVEPAFAVTFTTTCVNHTWPDEWRLTRMYAWEFRQCLVCGKLDIRDVIEITTTKGEVK